jgi:hypothetical protein
LVRCSLDGNKIPSHLSAKLSEMTVRNKRQFDATLLTRQWATVERLQADERRIRPTTVQIADAFRSLEDGKRTLKALSSSMEAFAAAEAGKTAALDALLSRLHEEETLRVQQVRALQDGSGSSAGAGAGSGADRGGGSERERCESIRQATERVIDERKSARSALETTRNDIAAFLTRTEEEKGEAGRLLIMLESAMRKSADEKEARDKELAKIGLFIEKLETPPSAAASAAAGNPPHSARGCVPPLPTAQHTHCPIRHESIC